MAERADITVDWGVSPRLAEVALPSVELAAQDAHDTFNSNTLQPGMSDDSLDNMDDDPIISSAGKEALGGGTSVGITSTLLDAQIAFDRTSSRCSGTITTANAAGTTLIDNTADFVTDGVQRGDWVLNLTDQSVTEVLSVIDLNTLRTRTLSDGTGNDYGLGDAYKVWEVAECTLSGGNFVAVDSADAEINPLFTTFGRFATRTASASATLADLSAIQFASFGGGVSVNTASSNSGTAYPNGNLEFPVNNLTDALTIAENNGFKIIYVSDALPLNTGDWSAGYIFKGVSPLVTQISVTTGANTANCEIWDSFVSGDFTTANILRECIVGTVTGYQGFFDRCALNENVITLSAGQTNLVDCFSNVAGSGSPTIDLNGTGSILAGRGYKGGLKFQNKTGTDAFSWDQTSGHLQVLATCSAGDMTFRGIGRVTDLSTGTCNVNDTAMLSGTRTVKGQGYVSVDAAGSSGTVFPVGTDDVPVNNIADAISLATSNNVHKIKLNSDIATAGTEDLTDYLVYADSALEATLTITAGTTTTGIILRDLRITGALDGTGAHVERCRIDTLTGMAGFIYNCRIINSVQFAGDTDISITKIDPETTAQTATFDFNGLTTTVIVSGWGAGRVSVQNMITDSFLGIAGAGRVVPHTSNTGGIIVYADAMLADETNAALLDELRDSTIATQAGVSVWLNSAALNVGKFIALGKALFKGKDDK